MKLTKPTCKWLILPFTLLLLICVLVLAACAQSSRPEATSPVMTETLREDANIGEDLPIDTPVPSLTSPPPAEMPAIPSETPLPVSTETPTLELSGLSADPQRIEFKASDGKSLVGYYYPAKFAHSPVIILMHWAGGSQRDYCVLAPWLQNRMVEVPIEMPGCAGAPATFQWGGPTPWWDPTWFPAIQPEASFAVFTFDFRDFGESEPGMASRDEWAQDALAAFETAASLEGVDRTRIIALGASIGADGAVDGCLLYNRVAGGGCLGGVSLSPGDYLAMSYPQVVGTLDSADPSVPAWCLAGEYDAASFDTCQAASGKSYRAQLYMGIEEHGMRLVDPRIEPNVLDLFLEFLALTFGL